jgi:hypothetical protein
LKTEVDPVIDSSVTARLERLGPLASASRDIRSPPEASNRQCALQLVVYQRIEHYRAAEQFAHPLLGQALHAEVERAVLVQMKNLAAPRYRQHAA